MINYDKPYTATAHIHSLDGNMGEITVLGEDKKGNQPYYIVDYKGVKCTAIFNWFTYTYYADDVYERIS